MKEYAVKGIVLAAFPQGEYGRRIILLTDKLGRVTAFAAGAAKANSALIGAVRPLTCAEFTLAKGKSAYNIHGARVMEAFNSLILDPEAYIYASYVLEAALYFSIEGMDEKDARNLLNLIFVTLKALTDKKLSPEIIRCAFELKLLVFEGEYAAEPYYLPGDENDGKIVSLWQKIIASGLSALYNIVEKGADSEPVSDCFKKNVRQLFDKQVSHGFKSLRLL